ncbi:hypothetical protein SFRURICE_016753 [Spodoptera frugiperda]|nr:hypothetical protein SFRURICE_016753 [Spodoptera frugiperda]
MEKSLHFCEIDIFYQKSRSCVIYSSFTNSQILSYNLYVFHNILELRLSLINITINSILKSLTANRKLLKANPPLTSVTDDHHGVQCPFIYGIISYFGSCLIDLEMCPIYSNIAPYNMGLKK